MSPTTSQNSGGTPGATSESREENLKSNSDQTLWGNFSLSLYAALAVVHTFGLHLLLYKYTAYAESSPFSANCPIAREEINTRVHQDCEASIAIENSEIQFREQWDRAMTWLVKAWSTTCTGCIILLPFPMGFFQITGVAGNIYIRTAVLSMLICSGIGLMTAGFYLQMEIKFKSKGFMKEWMKASQSLNNRDAIDFWTCLCLPVSLFAWAMFFCIVTLLTITMSLSPANEMEFNRKRVQAWHISSIIFLVTLTVGKSVQVYRFGKRVLGVSKF